MSTDYPPIEETFLYQELLRIEREQYEWATKHSILAQRPEHPSWNFVRRRGS